MPRALLAVLLTALLAACDAAPTVEPAKTADAATRPADPAKSSATKPADGGQDVPPSGTYEVTTNIVSDDCTPRFTAPPARRVEVQGKAENNEARLNAPISGLPPSGATTTSARSDFMVTPPAPPNTRPSGDACTTSEITTALSNASQGGFTLNFTVKYGPLQSTCKDAAPANCTTKIDQVFKLTEFKCAAECYRGAKSVGRDQLEIDCRCP